jgi:hypothetical protein
MFYGSSLLFPFQREQQPTGSAAASSTSTTSLASASLQSKSKNSLSKDSTPKSLKPAWDILTDEFMVDDDLPIWEGDSLEE